MNINFLRSGNQKAYALEFHIGAYLIMRFIFCLSFALSSFFTAALSSREKRQAFLRHEKKQKRFESQKKAVWKARLKALRTSRKRKPHLKEKRAFLQHEKKKKEFEKKRVDGFLAYKKQYKKYRRRQANILKAQLKALKKIRKQREKLQEKAPFLLTNEHKSINFL